MKTSTVIFMATFLWTVLISTGITHESRKPECPQTRNTKNAPYEYLNKKNPLDPNEAILLSGKELFEKSSKPLQCKICHGTQGDSLGDPSFKSTPSARNFTCQKTMKQISDGQLFWIIKDGSKGTSMPAYNHLTDIQIWQLIHYIRSLTLNASQQQ